MQSSRAHVGPPSAMTKAEIFAAVARTQEGHGSGNPFRNRQVGAELL